MEVITGTIAGMIDTFADELQEEGIEASELAGKTETGIAGLQHIGPKVFDNWVRTITTS